jgi:Uncharacterised protein family (UPF0158)
MSVVVSLHAFVEEMDTFGDECHVYLHRRTGEFLSTTDEEQALAEKSDDADVPDWQREVLPKVREALSSDDWLPLPSRFELDEYRIMERFCCSVADNTLRGDLLDAITGQGAFGRFKSMIHRHGLQEEWYRYREECFQEIARGWLEAHQIASQD